MSEGISTLTDAELRRRIAERKGWHSLEIRQEFIGRPWEPPTEDVYGIPLPEMSRGDHDDMYTVKNLWNVPHWTSDSGAALIELTRLGGAQGVAINIERTPENSFAVGVEFRHSGGIFSDIVQASKLARALAELLLTALEAQA